MTLRLLGLRVRLHATWLIVLALIALSVATLVGGSGEAQLPDSLRWLIGAAVAFLFLVSVLLHEVVHALVARRLGGQADSFTLLVFGGTPHLARDAGRPRDEALVAIAGPIASLLLGGAMLGLWLMTRDVAGLSGLLVSNLAWWTGLSNLLLGGLNLLPCFPLDGLRLLRAALWRLTGDFLRATRLATWTARSVGYAVVGLGLALALADELVVGIWLAVIGWLLAQAAEGAYRRVEFGLLVEDVRVSDVMEEDVAVVGPNLTLDTFVQQHMLAGRAPLYAVTLEGELVGTVEPGQVKGVPRADWPTTRVTDVMRRGESMRPLTERLSVLEVIRRLEESGAAGLPVVAEDDVRRLLGLVTREGLARAIRERAARRRSEPA